MWSSDSSESSDSKSLYLTLFDIFKVIKYSRSSAEVNFDPNRQRLIFKVKTFTFYTNMSQIHMQGQEMNHKGEFFKIAYFCLTILNGWNGWMSRFNVCLMSMPGMYKGVYFQYEFYSSENRCILLYVRVEFW